MRMAILTGFVAGLVVAAAALAAPFEAQAQSVPSFDCKKARTYTEKAICGRPDLAERDRRMARLYRLRLAETREYGEESDAWDLQNAQRAWLRDRDRCQTDACVRDAYDRRIRQLTID